jgi:hypothetical protein
MKNRIKNRVLNVAGRIAYTIEQFQLSERELQYERMIAESQAKIGPYKPASIPVQIWA